MIKAATQEQGTELWTGAPHPLGATWDGQGVNFAIYSRHADKVELCLYEDSGKRETQRIPLRERTDFVWHGYVPQLRPGQLYGYRVYGPYKPEEGHRFNPSKLLLDPPGKSPTPGEFRHTGSFPIRGSAALSPRQNLLLG